MLFPHGLLQGMYSNPYVFTASVVLIAVIGLIALSFLMRQGKQRTLSVVLFFVLLSIMALSLNAIID